MLTTQVSVTLGLIYVYLYKPISSLNHILHSQIYKRGKFPCNAVLPQSPAGILFERGLTEVKARYVELTAIPYRRDGYQPLIHLQCGPTRFSLHRKQKSAEGAFTRRLILRETCFTLSKTDSKITIQEIYARLTTAQRNQLSMKGFRMMRFRRPDKRPSNTPQNP